MSDKQEKVNYTNAIVAAAVCALIGMVCLATKSADPLWFLVVLVFLI